MFMFLIEFKKTASKVFSSYKLIPPIVTIKRLNVMPRYQQSQLAESIW